MRSTDSIKNMIEQAQVRIDPDVKRAGLEELICELEKTKQAASSRRPDVWRLIMQNKATKPIAAALFAVAICILLVFLNKTVQPAYAIEQTVEAMKTAYNVHGIWIDRQGRRVDSWGLIDPDTGQVTKARLEYEDGGLYIMADGKTYFEDDGLVAVKEESFFRIGLLFNDFVAAAANQIGEKDSMKVEKVYSEEFEREVIRVDVIRPNVQLTALVDIESKLPIYFGIPWVDYPAEPLDHTELIEYNVDLPPGFFDFDTGPDTMVIGKHLDRQFANDPAYGIKWQEDEDLQQVCRRIATEYMQARITMDVQTFVQLHPIYITRYGSRKMIERKEQIDAFHNGRLTELVRLEEAYEYRTKQWMVPCRVIRERNGTKQEVRVGVLVYLRELAGVKSVIINGYFPNLGEGNPTASN